MSEETKELSWGEISKEVGLEKFKDVKELAKSYKELESKIKEKKNIKELSDKELVEENKKTFSEMLTESKLDGSLKQLSETLRDETGVPTKLIDLSVAKVAKTVLEEKINESKKKTQEFIADAEKKKAVERGLASWGKSDFPAYERKISDGQVSTEELELLAKLGEESKESNEGLEESNKNEPKPSVAEYFDLLDNKAHIWANKEHPEFMELNKRKKFLEKTLEIK